MVAPFTKSTAWESANTFMLYTDNNDVFGPNDTRSQDPLFITRTTSPMPSTPSGGARWTCAGSTAARTHTDGSADDNHTNIFGGGLTLGHTFTPHFTGYVSWGSVLASSGNADEWLVRAPSTRSKREQRKP